MDQFTQNPEAHAGEGYGGGAGTGASPWEVGERPMAATDRTPAAGLRGVPWWAWTGGLYGVVYVSISAFAAPRLGLASMLTIAIAAQLIAALTIDHFGWLRLAQSPISLVKVMGVVLVLGGVVLVRRG